MENHVLKLHSCFHPWTGHIRNARHGEKLFQGIGGSKGSTRDPHKMHSGPMARSSMSIQRWSSMRDAIADTHDKSRSNPLDDPCTLSSRESLNTTNRTMISQRNPFHQVSRSEAPHEDESTAQPKHRMRRPAPPSIEEGRKIEPFAKKPITFMFHATYGSQLLSIMENGLKSGKSRSNPSGRMHVHMACIDDVILDDDESESALTHVPRTKTMASDSPKSEQR